MKLFNRKIKLGKITKSQNNEEVDENDFFLNDETPVTESVNIEKEDLPSVAPAEAQEEEKWLDDDYEEGQLSVDVYQTEDAIVIKSTIAGVKPEDIDISINNDMVTIRGKREVEESITEDDFFYQECYWGGFSRSIILPMEIIPEKVDAALKNGVLTVTLPKAKKSQSVSIKVKERE